MEVKSILNRLSKIEAALNVGRTQIRFFTEITPGHFRGTDGQEVEEADFTGMSGLIFLTYTQKGSALKLQKVK